MKAFLYALGLGGLLLASQPALAQSIPNNGFETWATPNGAVEAPATWLTTDLILAFFNNIPANNYYDTGTVTKTTDAHGGSYAAQLNTLSIPTQNGSVLLPGVLVLGAKPGPITNTVVGLPNGGSPYAARPTQLQFYYKLTGTAADSASALVYLTQTPKAGAAPTIVGAGFSYLQPTTGGYAAVTLPIQYSSGVTPDSVHVQFSSGDAATITAGTTLRVDDLALSGTALAARADAGLQAQLTVAPNPSPAGRFVISSPAQPALAGAPLMVLDALGRVVVRQAAQATPTGERALDLSGLQPGLYLLRLDSKQGTLVRQLVVQ